MAEQVIDFLLGSRLVFFVIFFACLQAFLEIGLEIGRRRRARIGKDADEGASLVVGSILGLLAFMLALNLSNASSRYDRRLDATLDEVNAIGTAMMQAGSVGGDQAEALTADLREYLLLRHDFLNADRKDHEIVEINAATNALQNRIWARLSQRIGESPTAPVTSLMNALNNAFDASTAMRLAMEYRMPIQVVVLLLAMSLLGASAIGYQFGLFARRSRAPGIVLSVLWCVVVTQIIDIGSARIWSFRTDTRVYEWSMKSLDLIPATAEPR
ncbi:MAG: hypothetical protein ACK5IP_21650 [Paracoccus sp. (in: a-proteobacteria)]